MVTSLSEFITAENLAKFLGVDRNKLLRWTQSNKLPYIRLGYDVYFHEPSVAAWLKGKEAICAGSGTGKDSTTSDHQ